MIIYWLIACLVFTLLEIIAFTGFATMAAIGSLVTALLALVPGVGLVWQMLAWIVVVSVVTFLCRKWLLRPESDPADGADHVVGAVGEIVQSGQGRCVAMFTRPVKGQVQWLVHSEFPLHYQQRVEVIGENGAVLVVRPVRKDMAEGAAAS